MNPWHDLELDLKLDHRSCEANCLIEIPSGSKIKYEIDKKSGLLKVDRILYSSVHYPCNYGLFPQTFCDDGDPLDVLVIGQLPVVPLSIMRVRPIGVLRMRDQGEEDDKVISVHLDDPEYQHILSIRDLPAHKIAEIRRFFESYKELEKKSVEILSIEDEKMALKVIKVAMDMYIKNFLSR
jgi:inorganic pyrophosphatase